MLGDYLKKLTVKNEVIVFILTEALECISAQTLPGNGKSSSILMSKSCALKRSSLSDVIEGLLFGSFAESAESWPGV
jgi:hypothetical protein